MARPYPKFEPEKVAKALLDAQGLVSVAARKLRCSESTVYKYIQAFPICEQAKIDARERTGDAAENVIFDAIKNGNLTAAMFYLRTVGKDRGYVERQEVAGDSRNPVAVVIERVPARNRE